MRQHREHLEEITAGGTNGVKLYLKEHAGYAIVKKMSRQEILGPSVDG
jgi:hypothetical protein